MELLKITAVALAGVMTAALLKSVNRDISIYVVFATVIIIFLSVIDRLADIFTFLEDMYDSVAYGRTFFPVMIKVLAVAYITDLTAQLCKDAGEGAIGSKVELAGKVIIFAVSMPVLTAILEMISSLLQ